MAQNDTNKSIESIDEQVKKDLKHIIYDILCEHDVEQAINNYKFSNIGLREAIEEITGHQVQQVMQARAQAKNITKVMRVINDMSEHIEQLTKECNDLRKTVEQQKMDIKKLQGENSLLRVRISDLEDEQNDLANEIRDINDRAETQKRLRKVY